MSVQAGLSPAHQTMFTQQAPYQQGYVGQSGTGQMPQVHGNIGYQQGYVGQSATGQMPQGPGNIGYQQGVGGAPVISELTLRVVSAALATIAEQLRTAPQALQPLCAQGQLTPQTYSNVLVESARRTAPIVAAAVSAAVPAIAQSAQQMAGMGDSGGGACQDF